MKEKREKIRPIVDFLEYKIRSGEVSKENGHKIFLCTGRNVSYARKHFGDLTDGFITNNGTLAYYEGDFIYDRPMDHELVQTIVDILEECEAGYAFHSKRQGYYGGPEEFYDTVAVVGDEGYLLKGLKEESVIKYYNQIKELLVLMLIM